MAFQLKWTEEAAEQYEKLRSAANAAKSKAGKTKKTKSSRQEALLENKSPKQSSTCATTRSILDWKPTSTATSKTRTTKNRRFGRLTLKTKRQATTQSFLVLWATPRLAHHCFNHTAPLDAARLRGEFLCAR